MKKTVIALAALAATSAPAMASSFDRGSEMHKLDTTLSIGATEINNVAGAKLGVEFELNDNFFLGGHYSDMEDDYKTYGGELGYKFQYSSKVDLLSSIGTYNLENLGTKYNDAVVFKAGLNTEVSPGIDLQFGLKHYNWDGSDNKDSDVYFGAQVQLTQGMSVGLMHDRHLEETSLNFAFNF